MQDDFVSIVMARRLKTAGIIWQAQPGDWTAPIGASYLGLDSAGFALVTDADDAVGWVTLSDIAKKWPPARVAKADTLWIPTVGQLKMWMRVRGYEVSSFENAASAQENPRDYRRQGWAAGIAPVSPAPDKHAPAPLLRHRCVAKMRAAPNEYIGDGETESDAAAETVIAILSANLPEPTQPQR